MKLKYKWLPVLFLGLGACDVNNNLPEIAEEATNTEKIALNAGTADFSKYVSLGASFTAGFTDNALFKAGQKNSFPNILASKFAMVGGREFTQPLMSDNIGGLLFGNKLSPTGGFRPRLYFNGSKPTVLDAMPTTEFSTKVSTTGNFGVPGAKSFHLLASGYGNIQAVEKGLANPYFARFATAPTATVLGDALAQSPTFFTLSEIGGNDVLGYALSGGVGVNQSPSADSPTGNLDPTTYGRWDITNPLVFKSVFTKIVNLLTANGAKGVVANVPYITSLAHFTTVPYNPLDPTTNESLTASIPLLNKVFSAVNKVYVAAGQSSRVIQFSTKETNPVIVNDESIKDLTVAITQGLQKSSSFVPFVKGLGLPEQTAPLVAQLLGKQYGKARPATEKDLLVLTSSAVIGKVNQTVMKGLIAKGIPPALAGKFSVEGVSLPLTDKWVLTPKEQTAIKTATDAYNTTIEQVAKEKGLALVNFKEILEKASSNSGYTYGDYTMTTNLVTGGLISLDGVHLTARGYAIMAYEILKAIDATYGSNFGKATNGMPNAGNYPTNYPPTLK